ncbi:rhodanese-like domain-containing protein [Halarcobacter ebronensis]|uniref:Sulfurtransferase n=1 Tax=Halarcobacter ebronensis TaxID=1462615 RepID=A0A4Q1AX59_9BACT|nr:rhodanese-like domain-containing protein [Halarcobacter ebronensis]QKF82527.1 rhodanese-like domain-containing protein [Halarcobacter ebronensis]RXK07456.1 sulfurtransferase [Halarcobacter ebronensis]
MKLFLSLFFLITLSFADFIGLTPNTLQNKIDERIVVIDIRTPEEWKESGVIPTSKKIMFFDQSGKYDVDKWLNEFSKYVKSSEQPFVLVCRSGNRTGVVGDFLANKLGYKHVFHLENGINSWISQNRITEK